MASVVRLSIAFLPSAPRLPHAELEHLKVYGLEHGGDSHHYLGCGHRLGCESGQGAVTLGRTLGVKPHGLGQHLLDITIARIVRPAARPPGRSLVSVRDDIDVLSAPNDVEAFQLQAVVGGAFARLEVIFVTVPGADEMDLIA